MKRFFAVLKSRWIPIRREPSTSCGLTRDWQTLRLLGVVNLAYEAMED